jgi:hypothetical protein
VENDGTRKIRIAYVDLRTGKVRRLEGNRVPSWIDANGFAYRTRNINGVNYFLRFDLRSGEEKRLCALPIGLRITGVSPDGCRAVFAYDGMISLARFPVYDISKNEWSSLETTGFAATSTEHATLVLMNPAFSMWSPKSAAAVLETLECSLPKNPIKAKTKLWTPNDGTNP